MITEENRSLYQSVQKEIWGTLHFEMSLRSLHSILDLQENLSLDRFADWVLFPRKIPVHTAEKLYEKLKSRFTHPDYKTCCQQYEQESEEFLHQLVLEMMYIQATGKNASTTRLKALFQTSVSVFYSLSLQLVEYGYCPSETMMKFYLKYHHSQQKGE